MERARGASVRVGLTLGALLLVMWVAGQVSTERIYVQGDGSAVGAVVYVDGRRKGTLTVVEGALPRLPSFLRASQGVSPNLRTAPDSGWTWLQPIAGHAACKIRVSRGAHVIMIVSSAGDTLKSEMDEVGEGADIRVSFFLKAMQVLSGST